MLFRKSPMPKSAPRLAVVVDLTAAAVPRRTSYLIVSSTVFFNNNLPAEYVNLGLRKASHIHTTVEDPRSQLPPKARLHLFLGGIFRR